MNVIESVFEHNPGAAQRILSLKIGIDGTDIEKVTEIIAGLVHKELAKNLQPEVEAKLKEQLPELIGKIGPDIALAGVKHLIKE